MEQSNPITPLLLELPKVAPDEEFIEKIKAAIKEGRSVEMLSSGAQGEIPFNMSTTLSSFLYTQTPVSVSISRENTQDQNSHWKLTITPPVVKIN